MIMVLVVQICVMTQASTYTHYFLDHHQGPIVTALGTAYTSGVGLDESVYTNLKLSYREDWTLSIKITPRKSSPTRRQIQYLMAKKL